MKKEFNTKHVNSILEKAAQLNGEDFLHVQELLGGTQSLTYLVNNKFVVKINKACILNDEYYFNTFYNDNNLTQKTLFYDNKLCFVAYKYIEGQTNGKFDDVNKLNQTILNFTQNYKNFNHKRGFGGLKKPHNSWYGFLKYLVKDAKKMLLHIFNEQDFNTLKQALKTIKTHPIEKKLLHGDLRISNLVFANGELTGIIDPYPIMGDYLFDYLLYVFSLTKITTSINLKTLHKTINQPKDKVKALMLITLCIKIKRMIKYNNQESEVDFYINLWQQIKLF